MRKVYGLLSAVLIFGCGILRADFKYSESTKITGGAMAGMMKIAGAFSKQAREPMVSTVSVKGNRLRMEHGGGKAEIIDLDGRRMIDLDTQKRVYSVVTFDEMRTALQNAQEKARAEQGKNTAQNPNVKITPKIETTPTGNTKVILDQPTHEVKVRMEMEMQSQDPKQQAQTATMWFNTNAWVAPSVAGYEQIQQFYVRMAKEMDWVPGAVMGGSPQLATSMTEFRKQTTNMKGFPLLQYASFGMAGSGMPSGSETSSQSESRHGSESSSSSNRVSSPSDAIAKSIGGMFGGFGKKKKKQEQPEDEAAKTSQPDTDHNPAAPPSNSSSLMEMTVQVTSYSAAPLDTSAFEIPAGFAQVQEGADKVIRGRR